MAKVLSSISVDSPTATVSAGVNDTFSFAGTPSFSGGGGVQRYDFKWEVGGATIAASGTGLITADTNPLVNTNSQTQNAITVTCDQAGSYTIRMVGAPTSGGSYTVISATRTVIVSAPIHVASGAVSAQSATVSGAASRAAGVVAHDATGSVAAQSATATGAANRYLSHAASGAVSAQSATASGTASRSVVVTHNATGAVVAQSATADGAAAGPAPLTHVATGSVSAGSATTTGAAQRNSTHVATGTVTADSATVSGSASRVGIVAHDATGAVIAQSASVSGEADNNYEQAPAKNMVAIVGHINRHTREKFSRSPSQPAKQRVARKARTQKRELKKAEGVLSHHWKDAVPVKRTELKVPLMQVEFKHLDFDDDDELETFL